MRETTIATVLQRRALTTPHATVASFLERGIARDSLTYDELWRAARKIAGKLRENYHPGERAVLLFPPGLDFIRALFGCFHAGLIAVPVNRPNPNRPFERIAQIVANADARVILTTNDAGDRPRRALYDAGALGRAEWRTCGDLMNADSDPALRVADDAQATAVIQHTSGTTGNPRGVVITHANIMAHAAMMETAIEAKQGDVYVSWLPHFHDMGLLGLLQTVYTGGRALLMSPFAFVHDPRQWLQAISRGRAMYSSAPNAAYELCVRRITTEEVRGYDLSHWRMALCGSEPIRLATIERFARHFAPAGFRVEAFTPCYGLAEATLSVTMTPPGRSLAITARDGRQIVGCGRPLPSQEVIIVDPAARARLGEGEIGEIWVTGPIVGSGYWRHPEATEATFRARLADGTGPWLRTGDLGFLADGELFVSGRQKDLIIIAGHNHYPEDIEATIEQAHPDVPPASAAAFAVDDDTAESLIVVVELPRAVAASASNEVFAAIRRAIAEGHDLRPREIAALRTGALPRTSSGKVQRAACRNAWLGGTLPIVAADRS